MGRAGGAVGRVGGAGGRAGGKGRMHGPKVGPEARAECKGRRQGSEGPEAFLILFPSLWPGLVLRKDELPPLTLGLPHPY